MFILNPTYSLQVCLLGVGYLQEESHINVFLQGVFTSRTDINILVFCQGVFTSRIDIIHIICIFIGNIYR